MIKKLLSGLLVATAMLSLSSCLNDKEEEVTYYDDSAMTAFRLGTVNRYHHTKAKDGVTDSTYKTSYSASSYVFYIDQLNRLVYNPDSLPYGTDAKHVLATITAKNSGTVVIALRNKAGQDSLAYYTTTDSLDLSQPTRVRVYNMRGTAYREYTVTVNVHQQRGDEMSWSAATATALDGMGDRRYVRSASKLYLFGVKAGRTAGYVQRGNVLEPLGTTLDGSAYKNIVARGETLYALSGGSLMQSADGETWTRVATTAAPSQLLGASDARLYGMRQGTIVSSADGGATWTADALDAAATNLPTDNISLVSLAATANAQTNTLVLVGTRGDKTVTWRKVEENASGSQSQPWAYYGDDDYNRLVLPALANLRVTAYGSSLVAQGGDFSAFYFSADQGLTWVANATYALPAAFDRTPSAFALGTDSDNMICLSKGGELWRGRVASMGWTAK